MTLLFQTPAFAVKKTYSCNGGDCIANSSGGGGGDWDDPNDWSPTGVPDPGDTVIINCGVLNLNSGPKTVKMFCLNGGFFKGSQDLTVTDKFEWAGGRTMEAGKIICPPACTVRIFGPANKRVGKTIEIEGTATWEHDSGDLYFDNDNGGQIVLKGSALLNMQATSKKLYIHARPAPMNFNTPFDLQGTAEVNLSGDFDQVTTGGVGFGTSGSSAKMCLNCMGGGTGGSENGGAPAPGSPPPVDTCGNSGTGITPTPGGGVGNGNNGGGGAGTTCANGNSSSGTAPPVLFKGQLQIGTNSKYKSFNSNLQYTSTAQVSGSGALELYSSTATVESGAAFNAGNMKAVNTSTLEFAAAPTLASLEIDNSTLRGTANVTVTNNLVFKSGYITGDGDVDVGGQTQITTTGSKAINRRILTNGGGTWDGGEVNFVAKGTLETPPGQIFVVNATATDRTFRNGNGTVWEVYGEMDINSGGGKKMRNATAGSGIGSHSNNFQKPGGGNAAESFVKARIKLNDTGGGGSGGGGYQDDVPAPTTPTPNCGGVLVAQLPQDGIWEALTPTANFSLSQNYLFNAAAEITGQGKMKVKSGGNVTFENGVSSTLDSMAVEGTGALTITGSIDISSMVLTSGTINSNGTADIGLLRVTGGTFTLNDNSTIDVVLLEGSGSTIAGTGNLTVTSSFTWNGGKLKGTGTMTVNGTTNFHASPTANTGLLCYKTLAIAGGGNWHPATSFATANIYFTDGAEQGKIIISSGSTFTVDASSQYHAFLENYLVRAVVLEVHGTLIKTGAGNLRPQPQTGAHYPVVQIKQGGSINILAGEVQTHSLATPVVHEGNLNLSAGTKWVMYQGDHTFTTGSINGAGEFYLSGSPSDTAHLQSTLTEFNPGNVRCIGGIILVDKGFTTTDLNWGLASGKVQLNVPCTAASFLQNSGGTLDGPGDLTVTGDFNYFNGTIQGTGTMTVNGTTSIGTGGKNFHRMLTAAGGGSWSTTTASSNSINFSSSNNAQAGKIIVPAATIFTINASLASVTMFTYGTSSVVFDVFGTLQKTGANNLLATFVSPAGPIVRINAGGTVDVQAGELQTFGGIPNTITHNGNLSIASGAKWVMKNGDYKFEAGEVTGLGEFNVSVASTGDTVYLQPGLTTFSPGLLKIQSGSLWVDKTFSNNAIDMSVSGSNAKLLLNKPVTTGMLTLGTFMTIDGTGDLTVNGNFNWTGGTVQGSGQVTVNGLTNLGATSGNVSCYRTLNMAGGGNWSIPGVTFSNGASGTPGKFVVPANQLLTVNPPPGSDITMYCQNPSIVLEVFGTLRKTNASRKLVANQFSTLRINAGGKVEVQEGELQTHGLATTTQHDGILDVSAGALFKIVGGSHRFGSTFMAQGSGNISAASGTLSIAEFTQLNPGNSPGILTIAAPPGGLSLAEGPILHIEIAGNGPVGDPTGFDRFVVTGTSATLGGTLDIQLLGGFAPASGQSFAIATLPTGYTGTFATLTSSGVPSGFGWTVDYLPTSVVVNFCPFWYFDGDNDGYGVTANSQLSCSPIANHVLLPNDCNDVNPAIHPGAAEICNGLDDDCNGSPESAGTTWTGNGDGLNWSDAANWSDGFVPLPCQDVAIPATHSVKVPAGFNAVGKTLEVPVNAELEVEGTGILDIKE